MCRLTREWSRRALKRGRARGSFANVRQIDRMPPTRVGGRNKAKMKRTSIPAFVSPLLLLVIAASLLGSCDRQPITTAGSASEQVGTSPKAGQTLPTEDDERKHEAQELRKKVRAEHSDWSEKQVADYVKGYLGFGTSPEKYAEARGVLDRARSLRCEFPRGSHLDLADPKLLRHDSSGATVTFDAIDRQRGHARIIAKSGAGDVRVITGPTALTFVEIADTGNPLVTVVFPRFRAGTREFYAVDSEHIFMFGDINIGQYYGTCAVLE